MQTTGQRQQEQTRSQQGQQQQEQTRQGSSAQQGQQGQQQSSTGSDVIVLNEKNFDDHIKSGIWFVLFYAPWCPHCQRVLPVWDQFAKHIKSEGVKVGKVDATKELNLSERFNIRGYPTFKLFRDNKMYDYQGERTVEAFTQFVKSGYKQANPQDIPKPGEKRREGDMQLRTGDRGGAMSFPDVVDLTDLIFDDLIGTGAWLVDFYTPDCGPCGEMESLWDDLGRNSRGRFNVGKVNTRKNKKLGKRFRMENKAPEIRLFIDGKLYEFRGPRNVDALSQFATEGYRGTNASDIPESSG